MAPAPSIRIQGASRPHWTPEPIPGPPDGLLLAAVCPGDVPKSALAALLPDERQHAGTLTPERRREWTAGRICLAAGLGYLVVTRGPLLGRANGAPILPQGIAGSISHKGPLAVAYVAASQEAAGVDVEYIADNDSRLDTKILTNGERRRQGLLPQISRSAYATLHFSVKEAIYKATSDLVESEFEDIDLTFEDIQLHGWTPVRASFHGDSTLLRTSVLLDGDWILAVATRAGR